MAKGVYKNQKLIKRASKERRTDDDGRVYDCLGERYRVSELRVMLRAKTILWYAKQPVFRLGDDQLYTADFAVMNDDGPWAEDLKGGPEERSFNRIKRLWKKYGPMPLFVLERQGRRIMTREVVRNEEAT